MKTLLILIFSMVMAGEMTVDGNLTVTDTLIVNNRDVIITIDSLNQEIVDLKLIISQLQTQIAVLEFNIALIGSDLGYMDCMGVVNGDAVVDQCGICDGDGSNCIVIDYDGNVYDILQFGDQLWMAENLKTTHYNDGSEIPTGYNQNEWDNLSTDAFAVWDDNSANAEIHGNVYNWYAVDDSSGLCMEGWHVPSDLEWMELEIYLGMSESEANKPYAGGGSERGTNEGSKLAGNADLWDNGDLENNSQFGTSGFNGLGVGYRGTGWDAFGIRTFFWTSSEYYIPTDANPAWVRGLKYEYSTITRFGNGAIAGFSVRCVKD